MKFTHPEILWALFLIIIPIIIHLFNFKRFKKVYFSNLAFLKTIEQQTKKHSQLRHWVVLLSRILFIAALVTAFAKPYFPEKDNIKDTGKKQIAVFLDNSFSMQQKGSRGILLEEGRGIAREIIRSYRPTDRFKLVTNVPASFETGFVSRDDFMSDLRDCDFTPFSLKITDVIDELTSAANDKKEKPTDIFIISDFQKKSTNAGQWNTDTVVNIYLIPLPSAGADNVFIDSCSIDDPVMLTGKPVELKYRIAKNFDEPVDNLTVKLFINGKQKAVSDIKVEKEIQEEKFMFIPDTTAINFGRIEISDYPVTFDDKFYFSFTVEKHFTVSVIKPDNKADFVTKFYKKDSAITLLEFTGNNIDFTAISSGNLIILNGLKEYQSGLTEELVKYVKNGGKIVFIPSEKTPENEINNFNRTFGLPPVAGVDTSKIKVSDIDVQSLLFKDVFKLKNGKLPDNVNLPYVKHRLNIPLTIKTDYKPEINLANGKPLLFSMPYGTGKIYYFTAAIDNKNSNFGKHIRLFVPLFYNFAALSDKTKPLFYRMGVESIVINNTSNKPETVYHIINTEKHIDFIPGMRQRGSTTIIYPEDRISKAGNYSIIPKYVNSYGQGIPLSINFPVYESYFNNYTPAELKEFIDKNGLKNVKIIDNQGKNTGVAISSINNDNQLWKIFILTALMFLLIEVFLLRFWK
jgi:hypothetical protein